MSTELVISPEQTGFTDRQVSALRALGVEDAPAGDIDLLFHQSVRTGLDPFLRQIYLIGRDERKQVNGQWQTVGKKWSLQTGIDGFRVIRDRKIDTAGEPVYQGQVEQWCGPDGVWRDVWLDEQPPAAARIFLYLRGREKPIPAVALWREYAATDKNGNPQAMWKKMPAGQLMKCAEALALRKAFPQDLSGVYVDAEMDQADVGSDGVPSVTKVQPPKAMKATPPPAPALSPEEEADVAEEWAGRARRATTRTDALELYREAKHRGFLAYATAAGEFLGEILLERGKALAAEEVQAVGPEPVPPAPIGAGTYDAEPLY